MRAWCLLHGSGRLAQRVLNNSTNWREGLCLLLLPNLTAIARAATVRSVFGAVENGSVSIHWRLRLQSPAVDQ